MLIEAKSVRGFNYHPQHTHSALEDWTMFDAEIWEEDLLLAKNYFPTLNTIRIWLSWNAFCYLGDKFISEVRQVIELCRRENIYVIPCLFNRWHDPMVDGDGIYLDHFVPGSSWLLKYGNLFDDYIDALMQEFKNETQILAWDLCNEPFAYGDEFPLKDQIKTHELNWLERMASRIRSHEVIQPIGIGATGNDPMEELNHICDIYLTHLYYRGDMSPEEFEKYVMKYVDESKKNKKPLITSECFWGALDDAERVRLMKVSLDVFKKCEIGFIAHALMYSKCTDLHDENDGRVSPDVGNLCFIGKDRKIRPGHEVFNSY